MYFILFFSVLFYFVLALAGGVDDITRHAIWNRVYIWRTQRRAGAHWDEERWGEAKAVCRYNSEVSRQDRRAQTGRCRPQIYRTGAVLYCTVLYSVVRVRHFTSLQRFHSVLVFLLFSNSFYRLVSLIPPYRTYLLRPISRMIRYRSESLRSETQVFGAVYFYSAARSPTILSR